MVVVESGEEEDVIAVGGDDVGIEGEAPVDGNSVPGISVLNILVSVPGAVLIIVGDVASNDVESVLEEVLGLSPDEEGED